MGMGIISNWNEIQKEFDLWEKTIDHTAIVAFVLLGIGLIGSIALTIFINEMLFIWPIVIFGIVSLLYSHVIGNRKIQAHKDRIDELKK